MLKKWMGICILFCFIWMVQGCSSTPADTSGGRVVAPLNRMAPLKGTWRIEECLTGCSSFSDDKTESRMLGKSVEFSGSSALIGENQWDNVVYKVKRVNTDEYLLTRYRDSFEKLGIKDKEVYVVTLSSEGRFLYDFIKISDEEYIARIDNEFFRLKKVSDEVDTASWKAEAADNSRMETTGKEKKLLQSGLLLGLRTPVKAEDKPDEPESYVYRTLWIASTGKEIRPVLQAEDLFVPRKSGFWKLESERVTENGYSEDVLKAYSLSEEKPVAFSGEVPRPLSKHDRMGSFSRAVLYAGNDYVSVEVAGRGRFRNKTGEWQENRLQTLPIDNIAETKGIKISDIVGENGRLALDNAISDLLNTSNVKRKMDVEEEYREQSFALYRKAGHWFFKGRMNFDQKDGISYTDYNIHLIPPVELVAYDMLHLPWTHVKDRIPQAVDAFTSPNRDIAVVVTRSEAAVYEISGEDISGAPLKKIRLRAGETVVMAEWSTGDYVDRWEKAFFRHNMDAMKIEE